MSENQSETASREAKLDEVIATYMQALEAGHAPDRHELLARHLDLAAELAAFFADQDRFDRLAAPLRAMSPVARRDVSVAGKGPGGEPASLEPGTRVGYFGDYELLEIIDSGAMGIVYKARQRSLHRTVALKMIRIAHISSPDDVRRFHREAEAAANLDDPHIVPIYDVGEHQGQHYYSMKLMEGGSLKDNLPRLVNDERAAAQLLATVARAVHFAHEHGILHRDLKPGNILLDARGEPHVGDFGLAKWLQEDAGLTQSGAIVGTPSYIAPEQALGGLAKLTTAADTYSLGAILYELLTGRPPFKADTVLATLRQVTDTDPYRPRQLNPKANRDLETICLKCLQKEPKRRYGSAGELADDLQRYLDGKPVQAARRLFGTRCRWPRRRRVWPVVTLVLVVLALLTLSPLTFVRVRSQREAALAARAEAVQQRFAAEENFRRAHQSMVDWLNRVDASQSDLSLEKDPERRKLLENALLFFETFLEENRGVSQAPEQTAKDYIRVGDIHQRLGQADLAEEWYRKAIEFLEHPGIRRGPVKRNLLGGITTVPAVPPPHAAAVPKTEAIDPVERATLARAALHFGKLLQRNNQSKEAEQYFRKAQTLLEEPFVQSSNPDNGRNLAETYSGLSELLEARGQPDEAKQFAEKARAVREKLALDEKARALREKRDKSKLGKP